MADFQQRAATILQRIDELAAISEQEHCLTRTFGTPAFIKGRDLVKGWMETAGLETRVDNIGNLRGKLRGTGHSNKIFVIGSHIDTVVNAGKYDGPLGVLMGLDLLEQLARQNAPYPFDFELIAFSDEEGVRFHTTFLGSKVVTGAFSPDLLHKTDPAGISLAAALEAMGADASQLAQDAIPRPQWLGYFEMHIEQGPVLDNRQVPVALVSGVAGQMRAELIFQGMAGHAGTVPMGQRQDALCAAAEFVLVVESLGLQHQDSIVATVGKLQVTNSASNVIPGEVSCTLDLRSADEPGLALAYHTLHEKARQLAANRNVTLNWNLIQETAPVLCDPELNTRLTKAIAESGHEVIAIASGAGHDLVPVAAVAPAAMLFIRCYKGISHHPREAVAAQDVAAALAVAESFLHSLTDLQ